MRNNTAASATIAMTMATPINIVPAKARPADGTPRTMAKVEKGQGARNETRKNPEQGTFFPEMMVASATE